MTALPLAHVVVDVRRFNHEQLVRFTDGLQRLYAEILGPDAHATRPAPASPLPNGNGAHVETPPAYWPVGDWANDLPRFAEDVAIETRAAHGRALRELEAFDREAERVLGESENQLAAARKDRQGRQGSALEAADRRLEVEQEAANRLLQERLAGRRELETRVTVAALEHLRAGLMALDLRRATAAGLPALGNGYAGQVRARGIGRVLAEGYMTRDQAIARAKAMGLAVRTRFNGGLELFDEVTLQVHATGREYADLFQAAPGGVGRAQ